MLRTHLITALTALTVGATLTAPTTARALTVIGDGRITLAFTTPGVSAETALDPDADDAVIELVNSAAATLDVCLYDFSHAGIVDAITAAADRVDDEGRVVVNNHFADGASVPVLVDAGDEVHEMATPDARVAYVSAHVAYVSPSGLAVGWGTLSAGADAPVRCLSWDLDAVEE